MNQQNKTRTDAHRAADRRYNNQRRKTKNLICAVPSEVAERFKEKCKIEGMTVNSALAELVMKELEEEKK